MNPKKYLKIAALAAYTAALLLLIMFLMPWSYSFEFPGLEVLTGQINLSPGEFIDYAKDLNRIQMADNFFLIAWAMAWVGFFIVVKRRNRWLGYLSLILGLSAVIFDFTENYYIASALVLTSTDKGWVSEWEVVLTLSYLLTFAGAMAGSLSFRKKSFTDISMNIGGVFFALIAAISFFIDGWYMVSAGWYLIWFVLLGAVLWKESKAA